MFDSATTRRSAIEQRRELHAQIARSRRRLNQRASRFVQGGLLPLSWRQRIQEHPVVALATAAGAGMLLAQFCSRKGIVSKAGEWLARTLAGGTWTGLLKQFEQFSMASQSPAPHAPGEPNDG